jgi:transcriptional regulator with XRE-family HTH domain
MKGMTGSDLRKRRLRLGWSRGQLAHRLGVSPDAVADWEEGAISIHCPAAAEVILKDGERDTSAETESRSLDYESRRYVG